ncbi:IclR family transcriptional regulator [Thermoanaerobacterium sp. DL9XJH110]|uniref:IclR family transcriptional regulator n=1 Tax=Thermoanaerobacterium sp. DL9XJH110 TaxID=3386643 RepID=UPI003BB758F8
MVRESEENGIRSVQRALSILLCFSWEQQEMSLIEICKKISLPKSTTSRLLATLENEGFLERNYVTKKYKLGPKLYYLGLVARQGLDLRNVALPIMKELRETTRETVNLYVKEGEQRVCFEQVESPLSLKRSAKIGDRFPLWAGASGKSFLAYMDAEDVAKIMETARSLTKNTIVDKEMMQKELEKIRRQGYAVSIEEREQGVSAVASPVFDVSGKMIASLSVSGPSFRFTEDKIKQFGCQVKEAATAISRKLGYICPDNHN